MNGSRQSKNTSQSPRFRESESALDTTTRPAPARAVRRQIPAVRPRDHDPAAEELEPDDAFKVRLVAPGRPEVGRYALRRVGAEPERDRDVGHAAGKPALQHAVAEAQVVVDAVERDAGAARARRAARERRVHRADLVGELALVEAERVLERDRQGARRRRGRRRGRGRRRLRRGPRLRRRIVG